MSFQSDALNLIAKYLPKKDQPFSNSSVEEAEYTVEDLAQLSHITVRNIRAYQEKGILPPPVLKGRKGYYGTEHLSKLRVAAGLAERGYSLTSIGELFNALESGIGLEELVGVEHAIASPWSDESLEPISVSELARMFGASFTEEAIDKARALDLIEKHGTQLKTSSRKTLEAGAALAELGMPLDELLDTLAMIRGNVETIADNLAQLVCDKVLAPYGKNKLPPKEDMGNIAELIWRLRPLAEVAVTAELARAMEKAAKEKLADQLACILSEWEKHDTDVPD